MDIEINIQVSNVQYTTWLRTSYIGLSMISDAGAPMVEQSEFGEDQRDAFDNYMDEATREVLKVFVTRQGDVEGEAFEYDGVNVIYRFLEGEPVLPQSEALQNSLIEDVKNALFVYTTYLWFSSKEKDKQAAFMLNRYNKLISNVDRSLYKLHD